MTVIIGGDEHGLPRGWQIVDRTDVSGNRKSMQIDGRAHWIMDLERAKFDMDEGTIEWEFVDCRSYPAAFVSNRDWDPSEESCIKDLIGLARSTADAEALFKDDPISEFMYPKDEGWATVDS